MSQTSVWPRVQFHFDISSFYPHHLPALSNTQQNLHWRNSMSRSSIPEDPPSDSEASWERVSNAGSTPTRAGSPRPSVMTDDHDQPSRRGSDYELKPGIYYIENDQNRDMVIDLSGYDFITILGASYLHSYLCNRDT